MSKSPSGNSRCGTHIYRDVAYGVPVLSDKTLWQSGSSSAHFVSGSVEYVARELSALPSGDEGKPEVKNRIQSEVKRAVP